MRDLKLLYRYATKVYKPKNTKVNANSFLSKILAIFILAGFIAPITIMIYEIFEAMAIPVSDMGLPYTGYIADIYMFFFPITFGIMLILTLVPSMIFNVYEADDMNFLLSLPIKKGNIFIFKALMGLSSGIIPLLILGISSICYAIVLELNIILAILGTIFFLLFIFLFSLALSSLMTRFINRSTARITSQIFLYINVISYIVVMNVFPRQMENTQAIAREFSNIFNVLEGKYSWLTPTNWALYAIRGDMRVLAILGILCLILIFIVIRGSNLTNMNNGRRKIRKNHKIEISRYPIIKKELRTLFRNPQNLFSISYAIIFPLVMMYVNRSAVSGAIFVGIFATIYASNLSLQLIAEEKKVWPFVKLLPVDMKKILQYKMFIPAAIFTAGYAIVLVGSYFLIDMHPLMFLSTIPMSVVILYSSALGLNLFFNDPKRGMTANVVTLKFSETLTLQLKTMFLSLGIIIPFYMWSNMYSESSLLFTTIVPPWWYKLLVIGLPWVIMAIGAMLVNRTCKKIDAKIGAWE